MPKKISDVAIEKVPVISDRFSLFRSKLQIAHYAPGSITDYTTVHETFLTSRKLRLERLLSEIEAELQIFTFGSLYFFLFN